MRLVPRFDARLLRNLRPYYQRRRLTRRARKAREARAAAAAAAPEATPQPREERASPRAAEARRLAGEAAPFRHLTTVFQTRTCADTAPTRQDWAFTQRLVKAGEIVGIGVRDHLLVASAERWVSLHRRYPW